MIVVIVNINDVVKEVNISLSDNIIVVPVNITA